MREENGFFFFFTPQRRHLGPLPRQVKPRRGAFHNLQQLVIHRAGGLRGLSLNFFTLRHFLFFLGITQQSPSHWIRWCQWDHHPATHPRSRPMSTRRKAPSLTHQPDPPASPMSSFPYLSNRGSWTVGSRRLPLLPRKEKQTRAELSHRKKAPSMTSRACSSPKQKTQRSCVSSGVK